MKSTDFHILKKGLIFVQKNKFKMLLFLYLYFGIY